MAITKATLNGKLLFASDYLSAVEFKGRDVTLTISSIKFETLVMEGGIKKISPVVCFERTSKKFVLNKTNQGTIADLHGTAAEHWVGKTVTLYPTKTKFGRETKDCIRVRDTRPKGPPTESPGFPEPDPRPDEDDFLAAAEDAPPRQQPNPDAELETKQDAAEAEQDRKEREELARITKLKATTAVTIPAQTLTPDQIKELEKPAAVAVVAEPVSAPTPAPAKPELTIDQALDLPWSECSRFLRVAYEKAIMGKVTNTVWANLLNKSFALQRQSNPELVVDETFPQTNIGSVFLPKLYAAIVSQEWPAMLG